MDNGEIMRSIAEEYDDPIWVLIEENNAALDGESPGGTRTEASLNNHVLNLPCPVPESGHGYHPMPSPEYFECRASLDRTVASINMPSVESYNRGPRESDGCELVHPYDAPKEAIASLGGKELAPSSDEKELLTEYFGYPVSSKAFRVLLEDLWSKPHGKISRVNEGEIVRLDTVFSPSAMDVYFAKTGGSRWSVREGEEDDTIHILAEQQLTVEHVVPVKVQWCFLRKIHPDSPDALTPDEFSELCKMASVSVGDASQREQRLAATIGLLARFIRYSPMAVLTKAEEKTLKQRDYMPRDNIGNRWQFGDNPWARYDAAGLEWKSFQRLDFVESHTFAKFSKF